VIQNTTKEIVSPVEIFTFGPHIGHAIANLALTDSARGFFLSSTHIDTRNLKKSKTRCLKVGVEKKGWRNARRERGRRENYFFFLRRQAELVHGPTATKSLRSFSGS
jgi:hypothetical protein